MSDVDVSGTMQEVTNQQNAKEAAEADIVPDGYYKFQLISYDKVEQNEFKDKEQTQKNPYYGTGYNVYKLRLQLTSKRVEGGGYEIMDRPRTVFPKITGATVHYSNGKLSQESELDGMLTNVVTKVSGAVPKTVTEKLDWFKDNAAEIHVTVSKESTKDGKTFPAQNWYRSIKPLQQTA